MIPYKYLACCAIMRSHPLVAKSTDYANRIARTREMPFLTPNRTRDDQLYITSFAHDQSTAVNGAFLDVTSYFRG